MVRYDMGEEGGDYEVFGVLSDNDEVDGDGGAFDGLDGTDVGI